MGKIISTISKDGFVKAKFADTGDLVEEARRIHNLSKTASAALGRTLTAAAIMVSGLKNKEDSLTIIIAGDGPGGRIVATCQNDGYVKGYVENPEFDLPIRQSDNKIDVAGFVGKGLLKVTMDLGMKEPYVGQVPLVSGEIAEDFANYLLTSQQIPSAVGLGVLVDKDLSIKNAGGFILELMPDCPEDIIEKIESSIISLGNITYLLENFTYKEILDKIYGEIEYSILEEKEVSYRCNCSREKVEDSLESLGEKELREMIEEDGHAHVECYFCSKEYEFTKEELKNILKRITK